MEEALHEGLLGIAAGGDGGGQFAGPAKRRLRTFPGQVGARCVDRLLHVAADLGRPVASDGIEFLQREAERIDHRVAGLTGNRTRLQRHPFPCAQIWMEVGRQRGDCLLRRLEDVAHHAAGQEHAAVDRRRGGCIGEHAGHVGMRQHARTAAVVEADATKRSIGAELRPVKRTEPAVEIDLVIGEQSAEVGATVSRNAGGWSLSPDDVVHEQFEARSHVGRDLRGKLRVAGLVFHDLGAVVDTEPGEQEIAELRASAAVVHHPFGLPANLLCRDELVLGGGVIERLVGDRVPEAEREPGRGCEAVGFSTRGCIGPRGRWRGRLWHRGRWRGRLGMEEESRRSQHE